MRVPFTAALLGLAFLAVPAGADAATNRSIQAFDQPIGFAPVWTPNEITAQPGDTITWHFDEPGNANAVGASHDLYLVRPGAEAERMSASYLGPTVDATLDDPGTYSFYCSIHTDTMRGTITVAAGDPTPAVNPGHPWESPAPPIVVGGGPAPLLNPQTPPVLLETGDTVAPTLTVLKVSSKHRTTSARVSMSEAGVVYARIMRGTRIVSSAHLSVKPGQSSITVKLPKRKAHYRLTLFARDFSGLQSKTTTKSLRR